MILGGQKIGNTTRTISGLLNIVYPNDVILLCDTSLGAVELELAEIPANFWNNQYKLYVVDSSNNAAVNNITIKAPTGFNVNNSSSFVLNVNGGTAIIRIANNTNYMVGLGYGAGAGSIVVQDEGVTIATNANTLNFVGAGVNATAVGSVVTVNIAGTAPVTLTNAQLNTLISTNLIVPNTWYIVSDAIFTFTTVENVPVLVQGVASNAVSLTGSGIFFNADYQQVGDYSGVIGFNANIGVWNNTLAPVIGDVVIWNNSHWVNVTGVNGVNSPNLDLTNWTLLSKSATNGYILEVDDVQYNPTSNRISIRTDKRLNVVENNFNSFLTLGEAFLLFQWGNDEVSQNQVLNDSCFECRNNPVIGTPLSNPRISFNKLNNSSRLILQFVDGFVSNNRVENQSDVTINNDGNFLRNTILNQTIGVVLNSADGNIFDNTFTGCQLNVNNTSVASSLSKNIFTNTNCTLLNSFQFTENTFVNSLISIVSNSNVITKNNFFESKLQVSVSNTGQIITNNVSVSEIQVATNNDVIGGNNLSVLSVLNVTLNSSGISRNQLERSNVVLDTNSSSFLENIFRNCTSVSIVSNSGTYRGNTFENTILSVVSNSGTIRDNIFTNSTFGITTVNVGEIGNNILSQSSLLQIGTNSITGTILFNTITEDSTLQIGTNNVECEYTFLSGRSSLSVGTNNGTIGKTIKSAGNRIMNQSEIEIGTLTGKIVNNVFDLQTFISITNACSKDYFNVHFESVQIEATDQTSTFTNLNCDFGQIITTTITLDYGNGAIVRGNYNSITIELDLSDPTVYDLATQTLIIPQEARDFAGRFLLKNAAGQVIRYITSISGFFLCEFLCDASTVVFNAQSSIPQINGYIVADVVGNTTITGRTSPSIADSIIVQSDSSGLSNAIVEKRIFA